MGDPDELPGTRTATHVCSKCVGIVAYLLYRHSFLSRPGDAAAAAAAAPPAAAVRVASSDDAASPADAEAGATTHSLSSKRGAGGGACDGDPKRARTAAAPVPAASPEEEEEEARAPLSSRERSEVAKGFFGIGSEEASLALYHWSEAAKLKAIHVLLSSIFRRSAPSTILTLSASKEKRAFLGWSVLRMLEGEVNDAPEPAVVRATGNGASSIAPSFATPQGAATPLRGAGGGPQRTAPEGEARGRPRCCDGSWRCSWAGRGDSH